MIALWQFKINTSRRAELSEGLPISILEAALCGLCVVCTNVGGCSELLAAPSSSEKGAPASFGRLVVPLLPANRVRRSALPSPHLCSVKASASGPADDCQGAARRGSVRVPSLQRAVHLLRARLAVAHGVIILILAAGAPPYLFAPTEPWQYEELSTPWRAVDDWLRVSRSVPDAALPNSSAV